MYFKKIFMTMILRLLIMVIVDEEMNSKCSCFLITCTTIKVNHDFQHTCIYKRLNYDLELCIWRSQKPCFELIRRKIYIYFTNMSDILCLMKGVLWFVEGFFKLCNICYFVAYDVSRVEYLLHLVYKLVLRLLPKIKQV